MSLLNRIRIITSLVAAAFLLVYAVRAEAAINIQPLPGAELTYNYDNWNQGSNRKLPVVNKTIYVSQTPCPHYPGLYLSCAYNGPNVMFLYAEGGVGARLQYMHELGHFMDWARLDRNERQEYQNYRGVGGPWTAPTEQYFDRPQERFAQDYALCSIPSYAESAKLVKAPCNFIRNLISNK